MFHNLKKAFETWINSSIMKMIAQWITCNIGNELDFNWYYSWSCYFTEKTRHIRHLLATARPQIFAPHFFTIEDVSLLEKWQDEKQVAAVGKGNFHCTGGEDFEKALFQKFYKESITKLLVSWAHQFIWPSFTLVFTRNGTIPT